LSFLTGKERFDGVNNKTSDDSLINCNTHLFEHAEKRLGGRNVSIAVFVRDVPEIGKRVLTEFLAHEEFVNGFLSLVAFI
jgi:hypothetical protein